MSSEVRSLRKGDKVRLRRPWGNLPAGAEVYLQADPAKSGSVPVDEEREPDKDLADLTFVNVERLMLLENE